MFQYHPPVCHNGCHVTITDVMLSAMSPSRVSSCLPVPSIPPIHPPCLPRQEVLLHHIAQQLLPFGPSGQPSAACLLYKALLHWKTFQVTGKGRTVHAMI